jgi:hypothetical protein
MNTTTLDAAYRIPTSERVVHDAPETPLTDIERAQFDAIAAAYETHVVNPDTETYDQARMETIGSKTLDIAAGKAELTPEFDFAKQRSSFNLQL